MKKIYLCSMIQIFLIMALCSQSPLEGSTNPYLEDYFAYPKIHIDNSNMMYATAKGFIMNNDQEKISSEAVFHLCMKSVLDIVDDRVYLVPENLLIFKGHYLLASDQHQWVRLDQVFKDDIGFYICGKILCDNGHTGIKKIGGKWCCLDQWCQYCCYYMIN